VENQPGTANPEIKIDPAGGSAPAADAAETGPDKSEVLVKVAPQAAPQGKSHESHVSHVSQVRSQDEPPVAPPEAHQEAEWYYVAASGRSGPVTLESLLKLAADGQIDAQAPVWKAGMPDWVALSRHKEAAQESNQAHPQSMAGRSAPKWCLWGLVLAPAWGALLQIIATEILLALTRKQLSYYSQMWWIIVVANFAAAALDSAVLNKSGQDVAKLDRGMFLLVPVYILLRDRRLNAHFIFFGAWAGSLLLSLSGCLYLNSCYARLLAP
jgi:hypothetical protein